MGTMGPVELPARTVSEARTAWRGRREHVARPVAMELPGLAVPLVLTVARGVTVCLARPVLMGVLERRASVEKTVLVEPLGRRVLAALMAFRARLDVTA